MADHPTRRQLLAATGTSGATALAGCTGLGRAPTDTPMDESMTDDGMTETTTDVGMLGTQFAVRVENVSTAETLRTMDGPKPAPLAPVAYALHEEAGVLFEAGAAAGAGLERLAEDGSPTALVEALEMAGSHADAAATPVGAEAAGPIGPGGAYEFNLTAREGQRLSLATMFVESNDLSYAPEPAGVPLWADGQPVDGDLTDRLGLWDAGTEVNQAPGEGGPGATAGRRRHRRARGRRRASHRRGRRRLPVSGDQRRHQADRHARGDGRIAPSDTVLPFQS